MKKDTLLVGSTSTSRQQLLKEVGILFSCVSQDADEARCDWGLPLQKLVEGIALYKMDHVIMPNGSDGQYAFVLTADTLSQDTHGSITGKPQSREHAVQLLKNARDGMRTGTAFCLDKKVYTAGAWSTEKRIVRFVDAQYQFFVPDEWLDYYLDHSIAYRASGAIAIEGLGGLFLKKLSGSYSAVMGLPLVEFREALSSLLFVF